MQTPATKSVNILYLISMVLVIILGSYAQMISFSWGLLATEFFLILAPALIFLRIDKHPQKIHLPFKPIGFITVVACLLGGIGLWLFDSMFEAILIGIVGYSPSAGANMLPSTPFQAVLVFLGFAVASPLCEEILFRGVIQTRYGMHYRTVGAITIPAVLFAMYHLRLVGLPALLPIAFFISYVYWRTGSLYASMLVHFGNNLLSALLMVAGSFSLSLPVSLPSLPAALVGIALAVLALVIIRRLNPKPAPVIEPQEARTPIRFRSYWPLLVAVALYIGLASIEAVTAIAGTPPSFSEPPYTESIETHYMITNKGNETVGEVVCRIEPEDKITHMNCRRETEAFELSLGGSFYSGADMLSEINVTWDAEMNLTSLYVSEQFEQGTNDWMVESQGEGLLITVNPTGQESETLTLPANAFVEDEWPWRLSAMEFNPGLYKAQMVTPLTWRESLKNSGPVEQSIRIIITGQESVQTPNGTYTAWHMLTGNGEEAWYAVEEPHTLLRYDGRMFNYLLSEIVN